jgi:hypothetical protein
MLTLATANRITRAKIDTLEGRFRSRVQAWLKDCTAAGLVIYVYEGLRTCARQAELFAQGPHVTRARPGQSMHQYGLAVDYVPLLPHPKAAGMFIDVWGHKDEARLYKRAQEIAARHQLRRLSWEQPHLEDATLANWQAAARQYGNPCSK